MVLEIFTFRKYMDYYTRGKFIISVKLILR